MPAWYAIKPLLKFPTITGINAIVLDIDIGCLRNLTKHTWITKTITWTTASKLDRFEMYACGWVMRKIINEAYACKWDALNSVDQDKSLYFLPIHQTESKWSRHFICPMLCTKHFYTFPYTFQPFLLFSTLLSLRIHIYESFQVFSCVQCYNPWIFSRTFT